MLVFIIMDIIKYIRPNKKHINLIICDDMKQIEFNIKNFLIAIVHISNTIYYAKFFNPPFFNNIICLNEELNNEDIRKIWNMTNTSGYFIIRKKYGILFEKNIVKKITNLSWYIRKQIFSIYFMINIEF